MKILLTSIGTRGDVEPFLAIGALLKEQGHEVSYLFPEQFGNLVETEDAFFPLTPKFLELIESEDGKAFIGNSSFLRKLRALRVMYKEGMQVNKLLVKQQYQTIESLNPDLIVYHPKCNYPLLWGLHKQKRTVLISPIPYVIHRVLGSAHVGFGNNRGLFNKWTYSLANKGVVKAIFDAQKVLPDLPKIPKAEIHKRWKTERLGYAVSPSLFKRPEEWGREVQVVGYHERNKQKATPLDEKLAEFLANHENIVLVTFGSMVNQQPGRISRIIYESLDELGFPCIINTAAGGLESLEEFSSHPNFYFAETLPYDSVLPQIDAIIHHGGSGTVHNGLKYNCRTLLVPHIMDQYKWNELIQQLGVGPEGISINRLKKVSFKKKVQDLMTNPTYKKNTARLAEAMRQESYEKALVDFITKG